MNTTTIRCALMAVACAITLSSQAMGDTPKKIDVPAGQLIPALKVLGAQTGVEFVYSTDQLEGLSTRGVHGELTAEKAVSKLLEGTKLVVTLHQSGAVLIATPQATSKTAKAGDIEEVVPTALRLAQNDQNTQSTDSPKSSSESSADDSDSLKLQEIIVTAQKRTERLIDTPLSIGVLSGADLDRGSSRGVTDVLNQVGGVSLTETRPGQVQVAVRGVISNGAAGTSTVGYYMDEVPFAFINIAELPDTNGFDLARVEVLRGPQGTLYGANALAGVVRVLTQDANVNAFEIKGRARGSSTEGAGDSYGGDLAVNVPLIPGKLAVRGVVGYSDLSGFIDSTFDGGKDFNDTLARSYRLKINYQPIEELGVRFGYMRSDLDNGGPSTAQDDFTTRFSSQQADERVLDAFNLIAEYRWSSVSLLSSTGYLDYTMKSKRETSQGTTRVPFLLDNPLESFSQELRLASELDGPWQWWAGAFYKDTKETTVQDARPLIAGVLDADYNSESYAVFGEVKRTLDGGRFELTGGLRYFEDRFNTVQRGSFTGVLAPPYKVTFDKLTWRALFAYRPQENTMLYSSVATGFRSGRNQSFTALAFDPSLPAVNPDSLTNYELGAKGGLFDGVLSYETAVYYTEWKDIQQALTIPQGFSGYLNAGEASGMGADVSVTVQPTGALSLRATIGWNDLQFDEDVLQRGSVLFQKGARVNDSPEWTGSIGGSFRTAVPMPNVDFVVSTNYAYGSQRLNRFLTGPAGNQVANEAFSDNVANLKASIGLAGERWTVDVYGDNLLNEDGSVDPPQSSVAFNSIRYRPRTVGLQTTFSF